MQDTLWTGKKLDLIGFGSVFLPPGEAKRTFIDAVDVGYRHFDFAEMYGNQKELGEGINEVLSAGKVKREDLWITSKLWNTEHHPQHVEAACRKTLSDLQLSYLDLYHVHGLVGLARGQGYFPKDKDGKSLWDEDRVPLIDTWREMEKLVDKGLVRQIGICNAPVSVINDLWAGARIKPAVVQVELHVFNQMRRLIEFCGSKSIHVTAFCPLARCGQNTIVRSEVIHLGQKITPEQAAADKKKVNIFENETLKKIASKHKKTIPQVALRYIVQLGEDIGKPWSRKLVSVIPKSQVKTRQIENFNSWFTLDKEDMDELEGLDEGLRVCLGPIGYGLPTFE
ncbi:MAG: alcohol dehydrogenase (NADP+) [Streblomastix strix]|uniref:Alcohol dehydrogenase (NADP+) n=1 Tax=Streblomastix strix TaxID=222440 RepID=A0A5J4WY59_9EUKA|nr:MAG: alcohol dehydrogenase (NADP+) [Streblomastix strix]